jgi:hypothetical protein
MAAVDLAQAQRAQGRLVSAVGDHPDVNGIGISRCDDGYVLKVNLLSDAAPSVVPSQIDGVTVCVQTTGRVRKRQVA